MTVEEVGVVGVLRVLSVCVMVVRASVWISRIVTGGVERYAQNEAKLHACVRAYVRTCVRACVRACVHSFVRSFVRAFVVSG